MQVFNELEFKVRSFYGIEIFQVLNKSRYATFYDVHKDVNAVVIVRKYGVFLNSLASSKSFEINSKRLLENSCYFDSIAELIQI